MLTTTVENKQQASKREGSADVQSGRKDKENTEGPTDARHEGLGDMRERVKSSDSLPCFTFPRGRAHGQHCVQVWSRLRKKDIKFE